MKKVLVIFCALYAGLVSGAGAVTIKKAAPVSTQQSTAMESATSLVPTALNIISGVKALTAKQDELTAECQPTQSEINWVNTMMKEWAKTGTMGATDVAQRLNMTPCTYNNCYADMVQDMVEVKGSEQFYDAFVDDGAVWGGFPMASVATYCKSEPCSNKNKKTVSNIYTMFALIDFDDADYSKSELSMVSKLREKAGKCSDVKIGAQKVAAQQEFIINTVGSIGQKTNTSSVIEAVSGISSGGLGGLGNVAIQLLDK